MPIQERVGQELRGFLGMNLRRERMNLEDVELAKAINADLHTQPGSILLRLDKTAQFSPALADLVIRRLARINSKRYQVAGRSVYRDQVKILDGLLSANLFTTIVPFRPLNDTTTWAFIADDALMRKDNGTTARVWGIAAPASAPVGAPGTGPLIGNYSARYTEARKVGAALAHEGPPSTASATFLLAGHALVISGIPVPTDPQVTHIRIYRTVTGGASHLFEVEAPLTGDDVGYTYAWEAAETSGTSEYQFTTAAGGSAATYAWEKTHLLNEALAAAGLPIATNRATPAWAWPLLLPDASLGTAAAVLTTDNDLPPPNASWATEFQEHMFLCRDAANPHYLWFSKRFRPESFPAGNFIEVGNPDDPLQCAVSLTGLLGVFTRRTKYRVTGNSVSGFTATEAISARGTPAPAAALKTERGIVFVARAGVFLTNLIQPDEELSEAIAPLFFGETVNGFSPINWAAAGVMAAAFWKGRYYLSGALGTSTTPDGLAVLSLTTRKWYFYDHPARSLFVEEDTDDLTAGFTDGFVYVLEDGATASVALDCETKDVFGVSPHIRKMYLWAKADIDTGGATVTVELYVDGVLKRTVSVTGTRTRKLIAFPEGSLGYSWRLRFRYTGTTRVRVHGAAVIALPLEAA